MIFAFISRLLHFDAIFDRFADIAISPLRFAIAMLIAATLIIFDYFIFDIIILPLLLFSLFRHYCFSPLILLSIAFHAIFTLDYFTFSLAFSSLFQFFTFSLILLPPFSIFFACRHFSPCFDFA
jgi:hypothetical protein